MAKKIIGITVGTPYNPQKIKPTPDEIKDAVDTYLAENPVEGTADIQWFTNDRVLTKIPLETIPGSKKGDMLYNTTTGKLYQANTEEFVHVATIAGANTSGSTTNNGVTWHYGTYVNKDGITIPNVTNAKGGDFYINTATFDYYYAGSRGVWEKLGNLRSIPSVAVSLTKAEYSALTSENVTEYYNKGFRAIFVENGYTNLVPTAIGTNGAIYYGCGYLNNYRLTSSGEVSLSDGSCISGYIPYSNNATIRVAGSRHLASAGGQYVATYDSSFNLISVQYTSTLANGTLGTYTARSDGTYELTMYTDKISAWSNASYFRVSCTSCVGADLIITVNEEIGPEV